MNVSITSANLENLNLLIGFDSNLIQMPRHARMCVNVLRCEHLKPMNICLANNNNNKKDYCLIIIIINRCSLHVIHALISGQLYCYYSLLIALFIEMREETEEKKKCAKQQSNLRHTHTHLPDTKTKVNYFDLEKREAHMISGEKKKNRTPSFMILFLFFSLVFDV